MASTIFGSRQIPVIANIPGPVSLRARSESPGKDLPSFMANPLTPKSFSVGREDGRQTDTRGDQNPRAFLCGNCFLEIAQ